MARTNGEYARRLAAASVLLALLALDASAQTRRGRQPPPPPPPAKEVVAEPPAAVAPEPEPKAPEAKPPPELPESVQADVSTRTVAVTSSFTGTEIVVFGAVENSRQGSAEAGLYDIVIVVEGSPSRVIARRKSNVGGLWINTRSLAFEGVPSFYAVSSTRPPDEIGDTDLLREHDIGFENMRLSTGRTAGVGFSAEELREFRNAVVRLKRKEGLYVEDQYGVAFIGRSLFRSTISLPANVTVGPFDTRVYLFRDDKLLSQHTVRLNLEREGLERFLHAFSQRQPLLYGIATVLIAIAAGLVASTVFRRGSH